MWFVVVLVSLIVLVILFLCIPIELVLHASTQGTPKFSLKLIWLFGLVSRDLRQAGKKPQQKIEAEFSGKVGSDWLKRIRLTFEILQTKGLLTQLRRFIIRTFRRIQVKGLAANLKVDLENPADTGLLFAFVGPVNLLIDYFLPYPIKIEPSFTGESFLTGYIDGVVKVMPIQMAATVIGLALSLPTLRVIKKLVSYKWKRKR